MISLCYFPISAYALLSGNQHYMTWDKRYFEFAGSCSYVLARDFVDQTFEVLVNYQDQREVIRKSLSVRTEGKDVEIMTNGQVSGKNRCILSCGQLYTPHDNIEEQEVENKIFVLHYIIIIDTESSLREVFVKQVVFVEYEHQYSKYCYLNIYASN
jgi:hypothetical protein